MIKVGFITTPLSGAHAVRGVGFYTRLLLSHLHALASRYDVALTEISVPSPDFDLIHYPFFDLFYHTLPFTKAARTIVTIHDVIPLEFPDHYPPGLRGRLNLKQQKLSLRSVSGVFTDSYASVKSIHKYLGVPRDRIKLIYLAASEIYRPQKVSAVVSQKYSLPQKFALFVGDINWNKNLPALVQSCLTLGVDLVIVGKQAAQVDALDLSHPELRHIARLRQLFSSPLIHRPGFVPDADLVEIYNAAAVYCQPSFAEGFGIPIVEAMACGTPVVCSDTSSMPEIAGEAAVYFSPSDPEALQKSLFRVLSDAPLRRRLSRLGLVQARKFSWRQTAAATLQAYQNSL